MSRGLKDERVANALPPEKDAVRLGKQYLVNLVYSIQGESFSTWINAIIEERNAKVAAERDMMIHLDPAVHEAFTSSTSVSRKYQNLNMILNLATLLTDPDIVQRGTGAHLLKQTSKRRRTKQELLLEAAEEEAQSQIQEEAKQRIEDLEA